MTRQEIQSNFDGIRNIIHLNKGNDEAPIFAVSINDTEVTDIYNAAKNKISYGTIPFSNMVSVGDPNTKAEDFMKILAFREVMNMNHEKVKSYYYPPFKGFPSNVQHCIPFESKNVAWNYYTKILTFNKKYTKILIIKS